MRQCTHCQAELPDHAQFCRQCGTSVTDDQAQSTDDTNVAAEQLESTSQAEQEQSQSATALADSAAPTEKPALIAEDQTAPTEEPALIAEDQFAETAQEPGERASADDTDGDHEEMPANEPADPGEGAEEVSSESPVPPAPAISGEDTADAGELQPASEQTTLEGAEPPDQGARGEDTQPDSSLASNQVRRQSGMGRRWLVVALVILLVLAGGAGTLALIRQQTSAGASSQCAGSQQASCANTATIGRAHATQLTFSGSISGPMTVSAQVRCQATTTQNLRTMMVTFSGTVGGQFYNFGFVLNNYTGPGTYTTSAPSLTILLDVPGEATNNGWGNTSPKDSGTITIARGEQAGNITYILSGFGTRMGTQVQVSGDWACG